MTKMADKLAKIAITGTPGTGKTSVAEVLALKMKRKLVKINDVVEEKKFYLGYDDERGCYVVDVEKLCNFVNSINEKVVIEGHLAHLCRVDLVIVLRCRPDVLRERLKKKGWDEKKIEENVEAEILDLITQEAVEINQKVYEIDTTELEISEVADMIIRIINEPRVAEKYAAGSVCWKDELEKLVDKRNMD